MFCPECGTQNPDGSKYCSSCAMQLPPTRVSPGVSEGPLGTKVMPPTSTPQQPFPPTAPQQQFPPSQPSHPTPSQPMPPSAYGAPMPPPAGYGMPGPPPYAGAPGYQQPTYGQAENKASGRAIAALVFAIAGFVPGICFGLIGVALGVTGVILGKMEMDAIKRGLAPRAGEQFAKFGFYGGIVSSIIAFVLGIAFCGLNLISR